MVGSMSMEFSIPSYWLELSPKRKHIADISVFLKVFKLQKRSWKYNSYSGNFMKRSERRSSDVRHKEAAGVVKTNWPVGELTLFNQPKKHLPPDLAIRVCVCVLYQYESIYLKSTAICGLKWYENLHESSIKAWGWGLIHATYHVFITMNYTVTFSHAIIKKITY